MQTQTSIERARELAAIPALVFFELRLEEGDDPVELASEISALGCSAIVDPGRRVINVFKRDPMPHGFGFL